MGIEKKQCIVKMYNQTGVQIRWNGLDQFLYSGFYCILFSNNVQVFLTNHWFPNRFVMYFIHQEKMMLLFQLVSGYIPKGCSCLIYWWENFIVGNVKKLLWVFGNKYHYCYHYCYYFRGDFIFLLMLSSWTIKQAMFCF